ncbi:hypothetical protein HG530_014314 [Fusarium avenaceum]|nr:hypothetical protein HG530_014314 [Fusarium avenaceum]
MRREKSRERFLEDLEEGYNHDDGENENAEWFETASSNRESSLHRLQPPQDKPARRPDDKCTQEIQRRVYKRCHKRQGTRGEDRKSLTRQQKNIGYHVDVDGIARLLGRLPPLLFLLIRQQLSDIALHALNSSAALLVTIMVRIRIHGL